MLTELNRWRAVGGARVASADQLDTAPRPLSGSAAGAAPSPPTRCTRQAVEPAQALDRASRARRAPCSRIATSRSPASSDEGTGRIVYRVADRSSGEVLHQSPPDALLRFFASARAALDEPLVAVEA